MERGGTPLKGLNALQSPAGINTADDSLDILLAYSHVVGCLAKSQRIVTFAWVDGGLNLLRLKSSEGEEAEEWN